MESEEYVSPILAVAALCAVFLPLLAMIVFEFGWAEPLRTLIDRHAQRLMLLVAVTATAGSLYYSEVVGFIPCEFCWYQRIMMYPLAVLLVVATVTRSRFGPKYLVVLATIGLCLSIYHIQLQLNPEQGKVCSGVVSCADKNVEVFGFVTIPVMAGCGFLSILLLQVAEWRVGVLFKRWDEAEGESPGDARAV